MLRLPILRIELHFATPLACSGHALKLRAKRHMLFSCVSIRPCIQGNAVPRTAAEVV